MPVLTINGRQVTVDDSFLSLPREEQDATVEEIASSLPKKEASGVAAGLQHGVGELINGPAETAKQLLGVGAGRGPADPAYVPADVRNGSWNPLNWNGRQIPQAIAEGLPGYATDATAGKLGSMVGGLVPGKYGKLIGGIAGAAASYLARRAGDNIASRAEANNHETPTTADKAIATAATLPEALAGALPVSRLIPGMLPASKGVVGAAGAAEAAKRYLGTIGTGVATAPVSEGIRQAGTTAGTEKGYTPDVGAMGDAAVNAAVTMPVMAGPKYLGDTARAGALAKFGGTNLDPTKNVATRIEAASNKLGNAKSDEAALGTVVSDLKNELGDAATKVRKQVQLTPEADNALSRAERGDQITPAEVQRIKTETAAAPDGPNAAFLAHSMHVADLMAQRGGHSNRGWAGGVSGVMDKNLGFLLNPARLAGGAAATALGMHLLGTSNPLFAGGLAATYGGARMLDGLTGMRSPAQTFVEHFADRNAQLRIPPQNNAPPQQPQPGPTSPAGPMGPWGPRPLAQQSVPPTGPQAPQAPAAPQFNPIALSMLKQSLKQGLPQEPQAPAAPEPINPLMMPRDITGPAKNLMAGFRNSGKAENTYNTATRKAEGVAQAEALAANSPTINEQGGVDAVGNPAFGTRLSQLLAAANAKRRAEGPSPGEQAAAKEEQAQAKASERLVKASAAKITKSNGKVESTVPAPEVDPTGANAFYEPIAPEHFQHGTISRDHLDQMARHETNSYLNGKHPMLVENELKSNRYFNRVKGTMSERMQHIEDTIAAHPEHAGALKGLLRQLIERGSDRATNVNAISHYAGLLGPAVGATLASKFNKTVLDRLWPTKEQKAAAKQKTQRSAKKAAAPKQEAAE